MWNNSSHSSKRKIYFHIGYPKTASTWFQESFFPKIKNIIFIDNIKTRHFFFDSDAFFLDTEEVYKIISSYKLDDCLFSSELLTTPINYGWHNGCVSKACADKIKHVFPKASVIIFIRNQQSLFTSGYQQYLKNGGTFSIRKFLYSRHLFSVEHLYFDNLINYYDSLFGEDRVHVFLFEEFQLDPQDFVKRFCEKFEFKINYSEINYKSINQGLRVGFIPLIRFFNCFHAKPLGKKYYLFHIPGTLRLINRFVKPLNKFNFFGNYAKCSELLREKDLDFFRESYKESNRRLAERIDYEKLKKFGYYL